MSKYIFIKSFPYIGIVNYLQNNIFPIVIFVRVYGHSIRLTVLFIINLAEIRIDSHLTIIKPAYLKKITMPGGGG